MHSSDKDIVRGYRMIPSFFFNFTQAVSYDRYDMIEARGRSSPCADNRGECGGAEMSEGRVASCLSSSAATRAGKGRLILEGSGYWERVRVRFIFSSYRRIFTPP